MKKLHLSQSTRFFIFAVFALVQFVVQVSTLLKGTDYVVSALTFDDAYYYLQTAWNLKNLGISSFDGVNLTNGVQLLWFGLIFLLAHIAQTKVSLLLLSMVMVFFFNAASYLVIWKLSETINRPVLAIYISSFWFLLTFGSEIYSTGMENSLHAFIFWMAVWQTLAFLQETDQQKKNHRFIFVTIILILNVWTRLDAAIFSVILYGYCFLKLEKRGNLTYILTSVLLALGSLIIQLLIFYLLGGTWLPISSLVKQSGGQWNSSFEATALRLLGVLLLLPVLEIIIQRHSGKIPSRGVWYSLLAGVTIHLIATGGIGAYYRFLWYLSPSFVFSALTLAYFGDGFSQMASKFAPAAGKALPVVFSLPVLGISVFLFSVRLNMDIPAYKLGYYSARWIAANLPDGTKMAAWNAGILGYFSDLPVTNLDGLINGPTYYQEVIRGSKPWTEYVKEQEIDFVIDYHRKYNTSPEFPMVRVFTLSKYQNEVIMWQVAGNTGGACQETEFLEE